MASTVRRHWRTGTLLLLSVALGSTIAAYHYATGFELGGGVFQQIGFGRADAAPAPVAQTRAPPTACEGSGCRPGVKTTSH